MELLLGTWHWAISGFLIGIIMLVLVYFGKTFGMSSNLRTMCTMMGADRASDFFNRITSYNVCYTKLLRATKGIEKLISKRFEAVFQMDSFSFLAFRILKIIPVATEAISTVRAIAINRYKMDSVITSLV